MLVRTRQIQLGCVPSPADVPAGVASVTVVTVNPGLRQYAVHQITEIIILLLGLHSLEMKATKMTAHPMSCFQHNNNFKVY